jgi:hypothetical protein
VCGVRVWCVLVSVKSASVASAKKSLRSSHIKHAVQQKHAPPQEQSQSD